MLSAAAGRPNLLIWAARLAVAGPLLCMTLVAVLHILEPEVNDSDAVSEYALGDFGWLMNIAFFSGAAGIGALAFVLHRSLARSKTAVAGIVLLYRCGRLGAPWRGQHRPRGGRHHDGRTGSRDRLPFLGCRRGSQRRSFSRPRFAATSAGRITGDSPSCLESQL